VASQTVKPVNKGLQMAYNEMVNRLQADVNGASIAVHFVQKVVKSD